ncbi:MAG: hypothetical protein H0V51_24925, partial [Chloroflexi bacterium]|nr:hypothetical protein [Chloroflexota bacterium]
MTSPLDPEVRQLRRHVGTLRRQIWLERALRLGARALALGFGVAVVLLALAWGTLTPIDPTYYGGPVMAAVGFALVLSLFRYPSPMEAARAADHRLGLRERIGTAVELAGGDRGRLQGSIARRQLATALDAAGWAREHWRGGPRVGRDLGVAAALGLLAAGLVLLTGLENRLPAPIPRPSLWSLLPRQDPSPEQVPPEDTTPRVVQERPSSPDQSGRTAGVTRALDDLRRGRESGGIGPQDAANRLGQAEAELGRQTTESRAQREAIDRLGR